MNDVVVTGMGILSSLGKSPDQVWNTLVQNQNGIQRITDIEPDLGGYGVDLVAPAVEFDLKSFDIPRKMKRNLKIDSRMLLYAGLSALDHAGISYPADTEKYNVGAVIGTGTALDDDYRDTAFEDRTPTWFLHTFPNLLLSNLSLAAGIKGYGCTMVNACSSGTQAIGHAFQMIQSGKADIIIAGGMENKLKAPFLSGFSRLNMTTRSSDPDTASKPFDKKRDGFVLGQGGALLVLESERHARWRGAKPLAKIVGYGASLDAVSKTDANKEGKIKSMAGALRDAGLTADKIGYINAHGTSTVSNDSQESLAIKGVFGKKAYDIPVNSTKSMMGHTFAGCGAIESVVCIQSLIHQQVHPTRNFHNPSEECDLDYVPDSAREVDIEYCMNNTSGIGGYNATLIFQKI